MSNYKSIIAHYEACLEKYGDSHRGVDWPREVDAATRYDIMLEIIKNTGQKFKLLDFGCGASHLFRHILECGGPNIDYTGLDLSEKFIALCRQKYPKNTYICMDVLEDHGGLLEFDYILMNGVFTEKCSLAFDEMFQYFKEIIRIVYSRARYGVAFNVMSKQVDWERKDLFHLPLDLLSKFLTDEISRHFVIRNDYGLYEYTAYVYRHPTGG